MALGFSFMFILFSAMTLVHGTQHYLDVRFARETATNRAALFHAKHNRHSPFLEP